MNNQIKEEGLTDAYLLGKYDGIKQGRAEAIDEFSSKLWQVIERATVNCKLDINLDDLHNLEIIIKGLAEELKEQK